MRLLALLIVLAGLVGCGGDPAAELEKQGATLRSNEDGKVYSVVFLNKNIVPDLKPLKGLTDVTHLAFKRIPITDEGLEILEDLTWLGNLNLGGTRCTKEGVKAFQKACRLCIVLRDSPPTNPPPSKPKSITP